MHVAFAYRIAVYVSSHDCPPDHVGQAAQRSSIWMRLEGRAGENGPWVRYDGRSLHKLKSDMLACLDLLSAG